MLIYLIFFTNSSKYETVYKRVINVVTSAHEMRSESYYVGLHFLEALNRKIF